MLAGPSELVEELTDKLQARDDCSNFDKLPTIGFKIKNKVLNLAPDDYMDKSDGDCSFSVMSLDVPPPKGPLFIFGDPFLRRFVTIYDKNGPRVGFAVAKHGDLDESQARKIISDIKGTHTEVEKPEVQSGSLVALHLDAGMMTRDSGSADHSGEKATDDVADEDALVEKDLDNMKSAAFVQTPDVGLRGRRSVEQAQELITVKLHKVAAEDLA
jgi:hypothetical protein